MTNSRGTRAPSDDATSWHSIEHMATAITRHARAPISCNRSLQVRVNIFSRNIAISLQCPAIVIICRQSVCRL